MESARMGQFISTLCRERGWTQKQLAEQIHVTDKAVSKWERGAGLPDISLLAALAKSLDVTVDALLAGERQQAIPAVDAAVHRALHYAQQTRNAPDTARHLRRNLAVTLLVALSAIGAGICLDINIAISGAITWSLYPAAGIALICALALPVLLAKRRRALKALLSLTLCIVPFLYVALRAANALHALWPLAVPLAAVGLAFAWLLYVSVVLLWVNNWYAGALSGVMCPVVAISVRLIVAQATGGAVSAVDYIGVLGTSVLLCAFMLFFGIRHNMGAPFGKAFDLPRL